MAAQAQISVEEYLRTTFDPDCEYVDGRIVERHVGERLHSRAERRLMALFETLSGRLPLFPYPALRMRVATTRYRIPDLAVFAGDDPTEQVPSRPPLIVIEVLSPDDRHSEIMEKLEDYRLWGVPHMWFVDPWRRKIHVYDAGSLREVPAFQIPEYNVEIPAGKIFE